MEMDNLLYLLIGIVGILTGGFTWKLLQGNKLPPKTIDTGKIREEKRHEIKEKAAADLIDAAPNADELRSSAAGIAEQAKQRLRDRARSIISGLNGTGNPDGG